MKVFDVKRNDTEPVLMEKPEQFVGMFLDKGEFDFGFRRSRIVRHIYEPGDLFIFPRHRPMFLRGIGANFMLVSISDAALKSHDDRDLEIRVRCQEHLDDKRIQGLMMALNAEKQAGFPSGSMFLESIELALASALRQGHVASPNRVHEFRGGLTPLRLRRVIELIDANLQRDLSLQELADAAGISISHFSRMFRKSTSLSPHQFVLRQRIQKAGELIRRSDSRVFDVASECGFKTQQHFARIFRRMYGVNPTEYRNLLGSVCPEDEITIAPLAKQTVRAGGR
jgi:AraC family transcriptional regulator